MTTSIPLRMEILSCHWISSQPRYDHFDTSPSYGKSPKETCFSVSDTSGAPRYVPLRCPKFYARYTHRRISTAAAPFCSLILPLAALANVPRCGARKNVRAAQLHFFDRCRSLDSLDSAPGGGRLAPHFDTSPYPEHYTNSPVENQGAWSVPPLASNVSSI